MLKAPQLEEFQSFLQSCRVVVGNKSSIFQKGSWRGEDLGFPAENVPCGPKDKMSSAPRGQKADLAEPLGPCSKELTAPNSSLVPSAGNDCS